MSADYVCRHCQILVDGTDTFHAAECPEGAAMRAERYRRLQSRAERVSRRIWSTHRG